MIRDYQFISPSLEGVLCRDHILWEGLRRPIEIMRVLDGPVSKSNRGKACVDDCSAVDKEILQKYLVDLYSVFQKRLSNFFIEIHLVSEDQVILQAMLQELIKVKGMLGSEGRPR